MSGSNNKTMTGFYGDSFPHSPALAGLGQHDDEVGFQVFPTSPPEGHKIRGASATSYILDEFRPSFYAQEIEETGLRFNEGKLPFHLIPPEVEVALASALLYGTQKYSPRNWEKGLSWSETYGSLRRHLNAWMSGEEDDDESGMPHLYLALANMAFLVTFEERGVGTDDRA